MSRSSTVWGLVLLACSTAWAGESKKLSRDLASLDPNSDVKVIVQWKDTPDDGKHQKVRKHGGQLRSTLKSIKAGAYSVPTSALKSLANDPDVLYVSPDRPLKGSLDNSVAAVNASAAWKAGWNGSGITVAVIDSGIANGGDLDSNGSLGPGPRVLYSQDFVERKGDGKDKYGHGTHVAGIIAATGKNSSCSHCTRKFVGIAPAAKLVNLRVLDENGNGTDSDVIAAIEQAIALKDKYNIRVINLSLGRPVYESYTLDPLCQAVEAAWKAGIVVVVAAGNDGRDNLYGNEGYGTIMAPGNDPYVITVGAMRSMGTPERSDDMIASYSSKGPSQIDHIVKPDIVAPGNQVVSVLAPDATLAKEYPDNAVLNAYYQAGQHGSSKNFFTLSGTSMATPVVSAAVADLLQAKPGLTPDQVKVLLMQSAYKAFPYSSNVVDPVNGENYVSYYDLFTVGSGYLDLKAALASLNQVPTAGSALSPVANYDPSSGSVSLSYDPSSVWADRSGLGCSLRLGCGSGMEFLYSQREPGCLGSSSSLGANR